MTKTFSASQALLFVWSVAFLADFAIAQVHTWSLDQDPRWAGIRNRQIPELLPLTHQYFGYQSSQHAGWEPADGNFVEWYLDDSVITTIPPIKRKISTDGFRSGAHHWRKIRDDSRIIQATPHQPCYDEDQTDMIASNLLLFQRKNGGWPKDYDMLAVLNEEQQSVIRETHHRDDTSYDNDNIHSQIAYLAYAYSDQPQNTAWRLSCERGLDFMLASQMTCGGFPQRYPNPKGYSSHITFNDGVMIGILNVLMDVSERKPHFAWIDDSRRARASAAVLAGLECILNCQIRIGDQLTGWCQQHAPNSYEATSARSFELASICPQETTSIVRFLMRIDQPNAKIVKSIVSAIRWLDASRLHGVAVKRVEAPTQEFLRHTADFDVVLIKDSNAKALWARHYETGSDRPIFAGRDAVKRFALSEIERERRTGTPWYGNWPDRLLSSDYPNWKRIHAAIIK